MNERLLIVGAGAQARYILETLALSRAFEPIGLIDVFDNKAIWGQQVDGIKVLGGTDVLDNTPASSDILLVLAVADVARKQSLARSLSERGFGFASVVHPMSMFARDVELGVGSIVNAGVIVERGTKIGAHSILHAGCIIEHDNHIGEFVNLGPGVAIAGRVRIERGATIFTGASIIPDLSIGERAVIGAGAVVIDSVAPGATVVGVPARLIHSGLRMSEGQ